MAALRLLWPSPRASTGKDELLEETENPSSVIRKCDKLQDCQIWASVPHRSIWIWTCHGARLSLDASATHATPHLVEVTLLGSCTPEATKLEARMRTRSRRGFQHEISGFQNFQTIFKQFSKSFQRVFQRFCHKQKVFKNEIAERSISAAQKKQECFRSKENKNDSEWQMAFQVAKFAKLCSAYAAPAETL